MYILLCGVPARLFHTGGFETFWPQPTVKKIFYILTSYTQTHMFIYVYIEMVYMK